LVYPFFYLISYQKMEAQVRSLTRSIDITNIGLVVFAFAVSFLFPFQAHVLSVVVLGPLHYLTELSWLKDRKFFLKENDDRYLLLILGFFVFCRSFMSQIETYNFVPYLVAVIGQDAHTWLLEVLPNKATTTFLAFIAAFIMVFSKSNKIKLILFAVALVVFFFLYDNYKGYVLTLAVLIPTILHTFIFTALFMLYGTLKSKSVYGAFAIVAMLVAATFLLALDYQLFYTPKTNFFVFQTYYNTIMDPATTAEMARILLRTNFTDVNSYLSSPVYIQLARFLAFMNLYHYLNWFSKTEIIRWHQAPLSSLLISLGIWLGCLAGLLINFEVTVLLLGIFSIMHVIMEFPLNGRMLAGIVEELRKFVPIRVKSL
jgi:hypothetical protein